MHRHLHRTLLCLLPIGAAMPGMAQESAVYEVPGRDILIHIRHWSERDGLSTRAVGAPIKDQQGFLWFTTGSGLERFDGYTFKSYGRAQGLRIQQGGTVVDAAGIIWLDEMSADGTIGKIDLFDPVTGRAQPFETVFGPDLPFDPHGLVGWRVAADSAICFIDPKAGLQVRYHPRRGLYTYPWPSGMRTQIFHVLDNGSVVATVYGADSIWRFVPVDTLGHMGAPLLSAPRGCTPWEVNDGDFTDRSVSFLTCIDQRWQSPSAVLKGDGRVYPVMNGATFEFHEMQPVVALAEHYWWCRSTLRDGSGRVLLDLSKDWPGLGGFGLRDGADRVWLGTEFGLYQITVLPKRFSRFLYTNKNAITSGTRCRGILVTGDILHVNDERLGYWRLDRRTGDTLFHDQRNGCFAIAKDEVGGVYRNDDHDLVVQRDGRSIRIPIGGGRVWAILPDPDGRGGWLGGENLLVRYDVQRQMVQRTPQPLLPGAHVLQLVRNTDSSIWAVTSMGLFLLSPDGTPKARYWTGGQGPYRLPVDRIQHAREDRNGLLWLSTANAGLIVLRADSGIVRSYDRSNGLPSDLIYASFEDALGSLWLPTDKGLVRLDPATERITVYTAADGITYDEFNRTSYAQADDGKLYFGGLNGVTGLDPSHMNRPAAGPVAPLVITQLSKLAGADRQLVDLLPQLNKEGSVELRHDDGQIELGFALLNYEPREQIVYEWMIEGENTGWSLLREPYLRLGRLPYGHRVLLVRARSGRTVRQAVELRIPVDVLRPFYLRWWAIIGTLLLTAGATVFLFRARVARVRREYALRDRIAMDLHDEVGSTLSGINLTASVARKRLATDTGQTSILLDEIAENTSSTMDAMHDIVWAINARYDDLDSVVARMRHHAGRVCEVKGVHLTFTADEGVAKVKLSMVQRRNMYLVFKEALNNALKYAQCTEIEVDLRLAGELVLTIRDNGKGFILEELEGAVGGGRNGLRNMQKRAQEIRGQVNITTAPREGTRVGSSRVDLQACKLEYSIVSPK